jgi:hypothetical protein
MRPRKASNSQSPRRFARRSERNETPRNQNTQDHARHSRKSFLRRNVAALEEFLELQHCQIDLMAGRSRTKCASMRLHARPSFRKSLHSVANRVSTTLDSQRYSRTPARPIYGPLSRRTSSLIARIQTSRPAASQRPWRQQERAGSGSTFAAGRIQPSSICKS